MSGGNSNFTSASLYVGDLAPEVSEAVLFDTFNPIGAVASIRVCRDAVTRRSLGYAYVNFHNVDDAAKALNEKNNTAIKGKVCRIMWSQRDPSLRKSGVGNIFIKNLEKGIDHKALFDTFSTFGNILSCKIAADETGSKGYAFVHYETQEQAEEAIRQVNGMMLNDQQVFVGPFIPRRERLKAKDSLGFTNVYVKNLDENVSEARLKELFAAHGAITSAVIMKQNGKSRGFGFVNFASAEEAKKAVDELNGKTINEKAIFVGRAQKKAERVTELRQRFEQHRQELASKYQGVNLYIKNLDDDVDDQKLRAEFAPFGNITSAKVMRDERGLSKGFGFVCYTTPEDATKAMTEMNSKRLGSKPLYVALAQRKDHRRAHLQAQYFRMKGPAFPAIPPHAIYPGTQPVYYTPQAGLTPQLMYPMVRSQNRAYPANAAAAPPHQAPQGYYYPQGNRQSRRTPQGASQRGGRGYNSPQGQQQNQNQNQSQRPKAQEQPAAPAFDPSLLQEMTEEQQFNILGEKLYAQIYKAQPQFAPKITGMLLDRLHSPGGFDEVVRLLEDQQALNDKISEALEVLDGAPFADGKLDA